MDALFAFDRGRRDLDSSLARQVVQAYASRRTSGFSRTLGGLLLDHPRE
jgi:hypothetical protein